MIRELTGRLSPSECPEWCEQGHHCTAHVMASGEHSSRPETFETGAGRIVATRFANRAGVGHLELRLVVALPADDGAATTLSRHLVGVAGLLLARVLGQ